MRQTQSLESHDEFTARGKRLGFARRLIEALVLLMGVLALTLGAPSSASAATRDQVFAALRLDSVPADYVVLVDNSGSMRASGLYARVRTALVPLIEALSPQDHVSLITFAGSPALRFTGPRGAAGSKVMAQLPATAFGKRGTDIGSALSAALSELQRPDASDVGAVVLMTDGRHTPPAGSAYPTSTGPSWDALGKRGQEVSRRHSISAYALALTDQSDADLLKRAFSQAQVVDLPRDQLAAYLNRIKEETRIAKARRLVAVDRGRNVQVAWPESVRNLDLTDGSATVDVTLANKLARVPVTMSALSIAASGLPIKASGLPSLITIAPGATKTLPVKLTFSKLGGFRIGKKTVTEVGTLKLNATVSTPWAAVLRDDLRTAITPRLVGSATATRATGKIGWGILGLAVILLIAALLIGLVAYRVIDHRRPKLRGSLTVAGPGIPSRKTTLHGRAVKIGPGREIDLPSNGQVTGVRVKKRGRRKGSNIELLIRYGSGAPTRVAIGHTKTIGDINFAYRSVY